jgi:hypothetical protein
MDGAAMPFCGGRPLDESPWAPDGVIADHGNYFPERIDQCLVTRAAKI